jgi:hypothetical protein
VTDDRHSLHAAITALIAQLADGAQLPDERDRMLLELAHYQLREVAPYRRFAVQRLRDQIPRSVDEIPALPTDAFRYARISSRPESEDVARFRSSGTSQEQRSEHALADLSLYDAAARAAARYALFPDVEHMPLIILAPHERELPDSSLSYMLARFVEWFGSDASTHVWPLDACEIERLCARLSSAEAAGLPVALLGTSFAFVHALDALGERRFALPPKSRIMQTGGFKGRSREVAPTEMRQLLARTFGIDERAIIAEYGMTELSSQLYENTLRSAVLGQPDVERALWVPGWLRVSVVDPESLRPLPHGREGLVRIDDLANLDSIACIQTADLGVLREAGLELRGRATAAIARGCSITADELLSAGRP